jgi:hypothetical protein
MRYLVELDAFVPYRGEHKPGYGIACDSLEDARTVVVESKGDRTINWMPGSHITVWHLTSTETCVVEEWELHYEKHRFDEPYKDPQWMLVPRIEAAETSLRPLVPKTWMRSGEYRETIALQKAHPELEALERRAHLELLKKIEKDKSKMKKKRKSS